MAKHPRDEDDEKEAREAEKAPAKTRAVKEGEEVNEASHQEPYPTGSPPDPMEEYNKAHPERSVEWTTGPEAAKTTKAVEKPDEPAGHRYDKKEKR